MACPIVPTAWLFALTLVTVVSSVCVRSPIAQTASGRTIGTNGFHLAIRSHPMENNVTLPPEGYVPGEFYTVVLKGWRTRYTVQTFRGFTIVAVNDSDDPVGHFQVDNNPAVRTADGCPRAVEQTSLQPKTSASVVWRAPDTNVGCVRFKAMVLEYRDTWYMDEGALTQQLCQIIGYERMVPNDAAEKCCACDEAKYELLFDGLWSRQTHPKDFPSMVHLTHFSDLIGASHSNKLSLWEFGSYATDGLKELAEWGNTYRMEQELKENAKEIRTIIKARGLWYPNVQGVAKASFRTDKYHHLLSMATMMGPSPDWCTGVTAVNLCLPDCTWVEERSFDLNPWDAGTDSGITYMSPNSPSQPRERIKKITTKEPSDPRSPFYDLHSDTMPPIARLTLKRKQIYSTECKTDSEYQKALNITTSEEDEYKNRRECMVGEWTPWSLCSATCGKGLRMRSRVYKLPIKAQMFRCERQMTEKQFCNSHISVCKDSDAFNDECAVSSWSDWSACSTTCGEDGERRRSRSYVDHSNDENGNMLKQRKCNVDLDERQECIGDGGSDCSVLPDPRCATTQWSDWSPCSASCGDGMRVRTRLLHYHQHLDHCPQTSLMQKEQCNVQSCSLFYAHYGEEICQESVEEGQCGGAFPRYHYDSEMKVCKRFIYTGCKGNRNRFQTEEQCKKACVPNYEAENELLNNNTISHRITVVSPATTTTELSNVITTAGPWHFSYSPYMVEQPRVDIVATVQHRPLISRFRPHSLPNDSHRRSNIRTRATATTSAVRKPPDGFRQIPTQKALRRIAYALNLPSVRPYFDGETGHFCVSANQLEMSLGLDGHGGVSDGGSPVDCMVTEWSPWSECGRTCGRSKRVRTRSIKVLPRNGGRACPPNMRQKRRCQLRPCPNVRCQVSNWSPWSQCSVTCGDGVQFRARRLVTKRTRCSSVPIVGRRTCLQPSC